MDQRGMLGGGGGADGPEGYVGGGGADGPEGYVGGGGADGPEGYVGGEELMNQRDMSHC